MPRREKFSKKSDLAFSSRNQMWEGMGQMEKKKKMPQNEEGSGIE